jgi:predicted ArsR family transcriptional regulator
MSTAQKTLQLLKTDGPMTAQQLARFLTLSSMGARRQLEAAQEKGWVDYEDVADKIGRPARHWRLTEAGHARFPDRHADLTLNLITQVRSLFGESGLDRLIEAREIDSLRLYQSRLATADNLSQKVAALAAARSSEGYMAESVPQDDGSIRLVEHHCAICAAARACQAFCRSELRLFQDSLGPDCTVERAEHLLSGGQRCVYVIRPVFDSISAQVRQ